jgi:hypothetical protein
MQDASTLCMIVQDSASMLRRHYVALRGPMFLLVLNPRMHTHIANPCRL